MREHGSDQGTDVPRSTVWFTLVVLEAMPTVADGLRQHGETLLQQYSDKISLQQRKVLSAIRRCRTGELGHVNFACGYVSAGRT